MCSILSFDAGQCGSSLLYFICEEVLRHTERPLHGFVEVYGPVQLTLSHMNHGHRTLVTAPSHCFHGSYSGRFRKLPQPVHASLSTHSAQQHPPSKLSSAVALPPCSHRRKPRSAFGSPAYLALTTSRFFFSQMRADASPSR